MNKQEWSPELIENIVEKIDENMVVPVIGTGVFYVEDDCRKFGIQQYVVKKILEREDIPLTPSEENISKYARGCKGMSDLEKVYVKNTRKSFNEILRRLFSSVGDYSIRNKIKMDSDIRDFIIRGKFPLIITTSIFDYIETHFRLKGRNYEAVAYQKSKTQDILINKYDGIKAPTIYHIFGILGPNNNVVITEHDFLQYLHYLQDTNSAPKNLKKYLKNKNILTLGCDLPDWTFRFLLFSLKEDNGRLEGETGIDEFGGGALSEGLDDNLSEFLSDINYFSHNKVVDFLKDLNKLIRPKLFLSLASEDYYTVGSQIKRNLENQFDIIMFPDHTDPQYWAKIERLIEECDYFMPAITNNAKERLKSTNRIHKNIEEMKDIEKGLVVEWCLASKRKKKLGLDMFCIPFYVGVDLDDFKSTLLEKDPQKEFVWSLFFPSEGASGIPCRSMSELTPQTIFNHIGIEL